MSEEQIVYYRSPSLLVTSGILVINGTRIATSAIRSVTPTQAQGSSRELAALLVFLFGFCVLGVPAYMMIQGDSIKWFPGVLFIPLCVPFFYWGVRIVKRIPRAAPSVSISVSDDEVYFVTFANNAARTEFCNALTRAMAEIR
jgi:uncharacterized membrane protein